MITFRPIGYVSHDYSDEEVRNSYNGVNAKVIVYKEYEDGLKGIESFSHIILISFLDKVKGFTLIVKPKRLLRLGIREEDIPEVGVFTTDAPTRPNPIGLSTVRLIRREGNVLYIENCDLFNNTPILDIKGFYPSRCPSEYKVPEWVILEYKLHQEEEERRKRQ